MIEYFKKDKLKASVIISSLFLFIILVIFAAFNTGDTYAIELSNYKCELGGNPVYSDSTGTIYCSITSVEEVPNGVFDFGDPLTISTDCYDYLNGLGYTYTSAGPVCSYVAKSTKDTHTITFFESKQEYTVKTCETDKNGYLSSSCLNEVYSVCSKWSLIKKNGDNEQPGINKSTMANNKFINDVNYYCVAGTSIHYECYVCNDNNNIMKWSTNGTGDDNCSAGYTKDTSINEANCKTKTPSCHVCNSDSNIMKWSIDGLKDNNCSAGYTEDTSINEANCFTVIDEDEEEPVPVPTGDALIYFVWVVGAGALGYTVYYFMKKRNNL